MIASFPLIFRSSEETLRFPENKSGSTEELEPQISHISSIFKVKVYNEDVGSVFL
jgi:hypothetical protein